MTGKLIHKILGTLFNTLDVLHQRNESNNTLDFY